jgi:hypothetical protein
VKFSVQIEHSSSSSSAFSSRDADAAYSRHHATSAHAGTEYGVLPRARGLLGGIVATQCPSASWERS